MYSVQGALIAFEVKIGRRRVGAPRGLLQARRL